MPIWKENEHQKRFSSLVFTKYKLACTADAANQGWMGHASLLVVLKTNDEIFFWCSFCIHMGKEFQKSALPSLFHFVRVRASLQLHVYCNNVKPLKPITANYADSVRDSVYTITAYLIQFTCQLQYHVPRDIS